MAGAYCRFCGRRCFVDRTLPDFSWSGHLATCTDGMAHDRRATGHDHTTALNLIAPVPDGLRIEQHTTGHVARHPHRVRLAHPPR